MAGSTPLDVPERARLQPGNQPLSLTFVVESGTDVRLVEGLARHFTLDLICREIVHGVHVSWPPRGDVRTVVGPPGRLAFASFVARELLTRERPADIILVQGYAAAALAVNLVSRLRRTSPVMLVCSPVEAYYQCRRIARDPVMPFRRHEELGLEALARLNGYLARNYVVLSGFLREVVDGHRSQGSIDIVPLYGVDIERFSPSGEEKGLLRTRLGLPSTGKIIFFSSRVAPEKDADTALHAVRELNRRGREVWLVNRSGGHQSFAARSRALGAGGHVVTGGPLDPRSELASFYRATDVCVQASREEGLGFSPLEALACGVPVVASAVGGLRETIIDGETGWSYPRGDAEALAAALSDIFDRPEEAARRTLLGRQMVLERFAERKVFADFEHLMRGIVTSRAARRRPESRNDALRSEPHP